MSKRLVILLIIVFGPAAARAASSSAADVTFAANIAPMLFENCATCHRPGQAAPFSLLTFADARRHAKTMIKVMKDRYMPPWQPEAGYGAFRGERRISDEQISLFDKWVNAGMEEGNPSKSPAIPKFPDGWRIGQPDLVVKMDRPFDVPADGPDIYRNFVIPLGLSEDKWVTAVEFRASAPQVVHHVLYFLDDSGRAEKKEKSGEFRGGKPGFPGMGFRPTGALGGWAVGAVPVKLPDGLAYPLKKSSELVLQTHIHPSGKPAVEELTVGIYFADKPPTRTLMRLPVPPAFGLFSHIDIPAGESQFKIDDSFTLPVDVDLVAAGAHAHYLGRTMQALATLPDGAEQKLFSIRNWDFNWQGQYLYKDYVRLPKGTVIHAHLTWDNSAANPRNPSTPPVRVRWGEGTMDEMGQLSFMVVAADEADTKQLRSAIAMHLTQTVVAARMRGDKVDWAKLGIEPPAFWRRGEEEPAKTH